LPDFLASSSGGKQIPSEELAKKSGKYKGFKVTKKQVQEIAEKKKADLGARDLEHAARIIEGTARSMGITVEG
jgi:large subunit ribosomal protein L11